MEEQKLVEREVMNEEEFKDYLDKKIQDDYNNGILHLHYYDAVRRFKSMRRAMRRGLCSPYGEVYPKRPFNNRKNTCKRKGHSSIRMNDLKKEIYGEMQNKQI